MVDIMKKIIILSVCIAVAMAFSLPSQAQRLIPKQRGIEVVGSVPLIKGEKFLAADNFGMGASLTRYLGRENYTFVMAEYEQQNMPYRSYNVNSKMHSCRWAICTLFSPTEVRTCFSMVAYPPWVAMSS